MSSRKSLCAHHKALPRIISGGALGCILVGSLMLQGCGEKKEPSTPASTSAVTVESADPGVVELSSPQVTREEMNVVKFEIPYKFTSGKPVKFYQLTIDFEGSPDRGVKSLENWEMKPEGVLMTRLQLTSTDKLKYRIAFAEADSPDLGYDQISNELTGELP